MAVSNIDNELFIGLHSHTSNDQIMTRYAQRFDKLMKSYVVFNLLFWALAAIEILLFVGFFTIIAQSAIMAFSLAMIFLTFFSYFILRIYHQAHKPEQLNDLKDDFLEAYKTLLKQEEGPAQHHMALANACCQLANQLHGKEYEFYRLPRWIERLFPSIMPVTDKLSCWVLWHDVYKMKEILLTGAVKENIQLVKCAPTNLEVHTSLANAYVMLSGLYANPKKVEGFDEDRWFPLERYSPLMEEKFRQTAERAIEEFKILIDYAPDDPWVHAQLAYSYRDLQMPHEEIHEYETILKINPDDKETLYKLGNLYFEQGLNSKGLRVYEELKRRHYKKADALIKAYGNYIPTT